LPLVHFLREVSAGLGWQTPPLRACYILDDPNLRWPSYGYVSFEKLVHEAREAGFHVAFATVPLDTWGSLPRAVSLFKNNTAQVSLVIHGNDHTRHELGQSRSHDHFLGLFARALLRIERFERVTGLTVERVMVPPHEALADAAVVPMLSLGIEGVSLTLWSLRDWNPQREWASTYGMGLAEITDGGFPALARFDLNEASEGPIVISAFLRNPIVLCGHHTTVASGLDILTRTASIVNSVGNVQWSSAAAILRSNYLHRRDDSTLWVKPYSCCIDVPIPDGVRTLAVAGREDTDRAFTAGGNWTCQTLTSERAQIGTASAFTVAAGDRVRLRSSALGTVDYHQVEMPKPSAWALSRRALCEIRDRLVVLKP